MRKSSDERPTDHARKVKDFVRAYQRVQEACHSAFSRGDENRAIDALDRMKAMERRIIILPESAA